MQVLILSSRGAGSLLAQQNAMNSCCSALQPKAVQQTPAMPADRTRCPQS